jgi:polysaccharide pyruvyl transferase WcaK-like protein
MPKSIRHSEKTVSNVDGVFMSADYLEKSSDAYPKNAKLLTGLVNEQKILIGLNVVYNVKEGVDHVAYRKNIARLVNRILEMNDKVNIVFFPFQSSYNRHNDLVFFRKEIYDQIMAKERVVMLDDLSVRNVLAYLKIVHAFVGMRYHSFIFGTMAQVPYIPVGYDEKVSNLIGEMKYPYYFDALNFDVEDILTALSEIIDDPDKIRTFLSSKDKDYQTKAADAKKLLLRLLDQLS